jgi:hypothetical protein
MAKMLKANVKKATKISATTSDEDEEYTVPETEDAEALEEDDLLEEEEEETGAEDELFDLDAELEGYKAAPTFVDPRKGIYALRVADASKQIIQNELGKVLAFRFVYQVLMAEEEANQDMVGGLFSEVFRLGGDGITDAPKMTAKDQAILGKRQLLARIKSLGIDETLPEKMARLAELVQAHSKEGGECMLVSIRTKVSKDGQYTNITNLSVLQSVQVDDLEGFDPDSIEYYSVEHDDDDA